MNFRPQIRVSGAWAVPMAAVRCAYKEQDQGKSPCKFRVLIYCVNWINNAGYLGAFRRPKGQCAWMEKVAVSEYDVPI